MAFTLTYDTLTASVTNYLERNDPTLVGSIPQFILLAQRRIDKDIKTLGQEGYITGTLTAGNGILSKPARWRNTLTFNMGTVAPNYITRVQLQERSYEYCRQLWPDTSKTGQPLYYADYGFNNWLIVPTPDYNYPFEIAYMQMLFPLDEANQTNWATQYIPEAVFYATLLESMIYIKDDERIAVWEKYYTDAVSKISGEDQSRKTTRFEDVRKD